MTWEHLRVYEGKKQHVVTERLDRTRYYFRQRKHFSGALQVRGALQGHILGAQQKVSVCLGEGNESEQRIRIRLDPE